MVAWRRQHDAVIAPIIVTPNMPATGVIMIVSWFDVSMFFALNSQRGQPKHTQQQCHTSVTVSVPIRTHTPSFALSATRAVPTPAKQVSVRKMIVDRNRLG